MKTEAFHPSKPSLCILSLLVSLAMASAAEPIAAFTKNARILFQGDSITDGNRGRSADPNHILGHGYVFIIGASGGALDVPTGVTLTLDDGATAGTVVVASAA